MEHHNDDVEALFDTFVDDVAFEPTYSQALPTAAGLNVATTGARTTYSSALTWVPRQTREASTSGIHGHASPVWMGVGTVVSQHNAPNMGMELSTRYVPDTPSYLVTPAEFRRYASSTPFCPTDLAHSASDAVPLTAQHVSSVTRSKDDMLYASPLLDLPTAPLVASSCTAMPIRVQSTVNISPNVQHETVFAKPVHASLEASPSEVVRSTAHGATPRVHFSEPRRLSRSLSRCGDLPPSTPEEKRFLASV